MNWPFSFYVCGEQMPRFGAMWHWVYAYPDPDMADHQVDFRVQDVLFSIDHDYDSEDAGVVDICAQQVLYNLLECWDEHLVTCQKYLDTDEHLAGQGLVASDVLRELRETLFRTMELTRIHPVVWWTNAPLDESREDYDQKAAIALAFEGNALDSPWPHRARVKSHIESSRNRLKRFHHLAQSSEFDKSLRKRLHGM